MIGSINNDPIGFNFMTNACFFCNLSQERIQYEDELCYAIRDGFPVSEGHSLVIPKRHIGSFFNTTNEEKEALLLALNVMKTDLDNEFNPDGYNVGINDGAAAGQTVLHLHIHLIPRYKGDKADPRGGIRWIFPEKADYWSERE
jgi:diadenosine tetraphosphate (Ap4A) HIT family hydrolase